MAGKNNIRSIRFTDELAELIDRQAGRTFTEKFENLVTRCVWELPQQEERLKAVQEQIKQERQRLYDLQRATEQLRMLDNDIKTAQRYFSIVERRAKQIAEAVEKDCNTIPPRRPAGCGPDLCYRWPASHNPAPQPTDPKI